MRNWSLACKEDLQETKTLLIKHKAMVKAGGLNGTTEIETQSSPAENLPRVEIPSSGAEV